jgi:hypothetical protein
VYRAGYGHFDLDPVRLEFVPMDLLLLADSKVTRSGGNYFFNEAKFTSGTVTSELPWPVNPEIYADASDYSAQGHAGQVTAAGADGHVERFRSWKPDEMNPKVHLYR